MSPSPAPAPEPVAAATLHRLGRRGRLCVLLGPRTLVLQWQAPWPGRGRQQWLQRVAPAAAGAAAAGHGPLLDALAAALRAAPRPLAGCAVQLRLDHRLVQLGVLRGDLHQLGRPALADAAQRWFARQLDTEASTLATCAVPQADGHHLLVAATDHALLAGARTVLAAAGLRLVSAQPALVPALVAAERQGANTLLARTQGLHLQLACRQAGAWTRVADDDLDQPDDLAPRVQAFAARCGAAPALAEAAVAGALADTAARTAARTAAQALSQIPPGPAAAPRTHRSRHPFSAQQLDFCGRPRLGAPAAALLAAGGLALALAAALAGTGHRPAPSLAAAPVPTVQRAGPALPAAVQAGLDRVAAELRTPWLDALAPLAAVAPGGVALLAVEPDAARGQLRIEAWAPDTLAMMAWVQRAEAAHGDARVQLDGWQPGRDDGGGLRFALQIRWSGAPTTPSEVRP